MVHHAKQSTSGTERYRQEADEVTCELLAHGLVPEEKRTAVERLLDEGNPTEALQTALPEYNR